MRIADISVTRPRLVDNPLNGKQHSMAPQAIAVVQADEYNNGGKPEHNNKVQVTSARKGAEKRSEYYVTKGMERKRKLTLQPRASSVTYSDLEYSAHIMPKPLVREVEHVFPGGGIKVRPTFSPSQAGGAARYVNIIIPVMQRANMQLVCFGNAEEAEKERLMARFFEWVDGLKAGVKKRDPDAWVDCTDPSTGRAHLGRCGAGFSDVEGFCAVDTFPTEMAGACRILRHPRWQAAVYPTLAFCNAKWVTVKQALDELNGFDSSNGKENEEENENEAVSGAMEKLSILEKEEGFKK